MSHLFRAKRTSVTACWYLLQKLLMEEYEAGVRMPQQDFVSGAWSAYIDKAVALKGHWMRAGVDFNMTSTQIVNTLSSLLLSS
jgi:hypothetical protein